MGLPARRDPHIFTPDNHPALQRRRVATDPEGIDPSRPIPLFPALRRSSYRRRLWLLAGGVALFLSIVTGTELARRAAAVASAPPASAGPAGAKATAGADLFALDFIAFYTGGHLVADGRHRELFDLHAVKRFQNDLAAANGADLGEALGPWWNPPFYAWVFAPLSALPFAAATRVWVGFNVACAAVACGLLVRMLPNRTADGRVIDWRTKALVPVLVGLSVPFIHSITHGQNTGTSLLIVTAAAAAWRADRPVLAGLVAGLMAYKPQHAVVLGGVLALSLGWRAVMGLAATGTALLLVTLLTLPGSLGDFLREVPKNVAFVQEQCVYMWERHATLKAFWRLLLQGREVGPPSTWVTLLTALCTADMAVGLLRLTPAWRWADPFDRAEQTADRRDRLIAATFLATPLLMPFYFDYDLLLLAVPAVLMAGLKLRTGRLVDGGRLDRALLVLFPIAYAWMLLNADVAERTHVNGAVVLLAALATASGWPVRDRRDSVQPVEAPGESPMRLNPEPSPLSRAA